MVRENMELYKNSNSLGKNQPNWVGETEICKWGGNLKAHHGRDNRSPSNGHVLDSPLAEL